MNADQCTEAMCVYLASRLRPAVAGVAEEVRNDIRESINIPDGGTPSKPIHSKPGEPPRRETGAYRDSWVIDSSQSGDSVTASAGTTSNLGPMLEFGTTKMSARPHVSPVFQRLLEDPAGRIQAKL